MDLNERSIAVGILHDGIISSIERNQNKLLLKVHIQYLAEMIGRNFDYFTYEFLHCDDTYFVYWDSESRVEMTNEMSNLCLEINESDIDGEYIKVSCLCYKPGIEGGFLYIKANQLVIYDHEENELSFEDIRNAAKEYWK